MWVEGLRDFGYQWKRLRQSQTGRMGGTISPRTVHHPFTRFGQFWHIIFTYHLSLITYHLSPITYHLSLDSIPDRHLRLHGFGELEEPVMAHLGVGGREKRDRIKGGALVELGHESGPDAAGGLLA